MTTKKLVSREQFWAELEAIGGDRVRALLSAGRFEPGKKALAEEWLELKREERTNAASQPVRRHERPPTLKLSFPSTSSFPAILAAAAIVLAMVAAIVMSVW